MQSSGRESIDGAVDDPRGRAGQCSGSRAQPACAADITHPAMVYPSREELLLVNKNVMCPEPGCGMVFAQSSALRFHVTRRHWQHKLTPGSVHGFQAVYVCPDRATCGRDGFNSLKALKQHYHKLHAPRSHQCSKCGKVSFATKPLLRAHETTCGVRFLCHCGMEFTVKHGLKKHMEKHHKSGLPKIISRDKLTKSAARVGSWMLPVQPLKRFGPRLLLPRAPPRIGLLPQLVSVPSYVLAAASRGNDAQTNISLNGRRPQMIHVGTQTNEMDSCMQSATVPSGAMLPGSSVAALEGKSTSQSQSHPVVTTMREMHPGRDEPTHVISISGLRNQNISCRLAIDNPQPLRSAADLDRLLPSDIWFVSSPSGQVSISSASRPGNSKLRMIQHLENPPVRGMCTTYEQQEGIFGEADQLPRTTEVRLSENTQLSTAHELSGKAPNKTILSNSLVDAQPPLSPVSTRDRLWSTVTAAPLTSIETQTELTTGLDSLLWAEDIKDTWVHTGCQTGPAVSPAETQPRPATEMFSAETQTMPWLDGDVQLFSELGEFNGNDIETQTRWLTDDSQTQTNWDLGNNVGNPVGLVPSHLQNATSQTQACFDGDILHDQVVVTSQTQTNSLGDELTAALDIDVVTSQTQTNLMCDNVSVTDGDLMTSQTQTQWLSDAAPTESELMTSQTQTLPWFDEFETEFMTSETQTLPWMSPTGSADTLMTSRVSQLTHTETQTCLLCLAGPCDCWPTE